MTTAMLTTKQRFFLAARELKRMLGLPVSYRDHEFLYFKCREDWSRLPADRISRLSTLFGREADAIRSYVAEAEAIVLEEREIPPRDNGTEIGNPMGKTDRITLYVIVRICKPRVVVETGCAAGASATYILSALHMNGCGSLYSIDAAADRTHIGCLVPDAMRATFNLRYGDSLSLIPEIAAEAGAIDFFLHDSLHTYPHMTAEYELFYRYLGTGGGVICSHDILMSNAWSHFIRRHRLKQCVVIKNLGVAMIKT